MKPELKLGLRHTQRLAVADSLTVPALAHAFDSFLDMPPVFATAMLVGFVEWACIEALRPYLEEGERTVGTHIEISHVAATPAGMTVAAEVELVKIQGRRLRFKVSCRDDLDLVAEGFHERSSIDGAKFAARVSAKSARAAARSVP
jgi:fluoroacetyl-CoA thioesterase